MDIKPFLFLLLVLFSAVALYSFNKLTAHQDMVLYNNGALITQEVNNGSLELPDDVILNSIIGEDYVLHKKYPLNSYILGNEVVVKKEGRTYEGVVLMYNDNEIIIKDDTKTYIVYSPESVELKKSIPSTILKNWLNVNGKITYAISSLKWEGKSILYVDDINSKFKVGALIKNNELHNTFKGNVKLFSGTIPFYHQYFRYEMTNSINPIDKEDVELGEGHSIYSLGYMEIPSGTEIYKELNSFEPDVKRYVEFSLSPLYSTTTKGIDVFSFKALEDICPGYVDIFYKNVFVGRVNINGFVENENVILKAGLDRYVLLKQSITSRNETKTDIYLTNKINITNYANYKNEVNIEFNIYDTFKPTSLPTFCKSSGDKIICNLNVNAKSNKEFTIGLHIIKQNNYILGG